MCLKGYVGIKGCGTDTPLSGQYINQLPGISLQSVQQTADREQVTYASVFSDVQDRAWRRFESDVRNRLSARYSLKTVRDLVHIQVETSGGNQAPSPYYKGLVIDSDYQANSFFSFFVSTVFITLETEEASLDIHVFDRYGEILDTIHATGLIAGENAVTVNKSYAASLIFIAVDATALTTVNTKVVHEAYDQYYACLSCYSESEACIYGAMAPTAASALRTKSSSTFGLSVIVTPTCDYTSLICRNKSLFLNAWMNLLGAELMLERMYSPRINKLTTVDADDASGLRDLYTAQYEQALEDAVSGIHISNNDGCVECKQTIKRKEVLP